MRLVYIFAAILAVSVAETSDQKYDDLVAMETIELKKESSDLTPQASVYNYIPPSQRPPQWNQNYVQNYVPSQTWTPPKVDNIQPINTQVPSIPNNPLYVPSVPVTASPVQSDYVPPQNNYVPPQNNYAPPQNNYVPPQNNYVPPQNNYVPPQNNYVPPQNNYYPQWSTPNYQSTTTPIPVIKNEQYFGDNGSYKYEYQIADGTHVGEEGYHTDPKGTDESLVKKGWYSYRGADGKTYTVTYWADHTGFHAYGDHLPTPPPVPAAIQAALDKEEAEKNKQPATYPPTTQKPFYPQQTYYPPQQTYYPPQQTYYPPQQSGYGK